MDWFKADRIGLSPLEMRELKKALKSKTIWFGIIVAVLSVLQGFIFVLPFDPHWQALVGVLIAVVIVILRFLTHGSIDDK